MALKDETQLQNNLGKMNNS